MKTGEVWRNSFNNIEIEIIQVLELTLNGKQVKHYLAVNKPIQYHPEELWVLKDEDKYRWHKLVEYKKED